MQIVSFQKVKEDIINSIRGQKLIPFIGSGFTRGCAAKTGTVPSGTDYKEYMIKAIVENNSLSLDEEKTLKAQNFSAISSIYHSEVPMEQQREYLLRNFSQVSIEENKRHFLNLAWPYVYTLNTDDGIERNCKYSTVVYSNRQVSKSIFDERKCVIKLHGDVSDMLTYMDSDSEIFDKKQYALSLFTTNTSLLKKLEHDFGYHNLLFVGCSLDDETDLLAVAGSVESNDVARYYCTTSEPDFVTKSKLKDFGITHCVLFETYDEIYNEIVEAGKEALNIPASEIEQFKSTQFTKLSSEFKINEQYFYHGKSLISKDRSITLPYFFISRELTQTIIKGFVEKPVQILIGNGVSGKTYVAVDVAMHFRSKNVYFFESKDRLSDDAFSQLLTVKNGVIISDSSSLDIHQAETVIKSIDQLIENNTYWLIVANKSNRDLPGLIRHLEYKNIIGFEDVPQYYLPNRLSDSEIACINELLVTANLGVFMSAHSIVDNIISCSKNISHKHKYEAITPKYKDTRDIACLIALATERKVYSSRVTELDLIGEMYDQQKTAFPLIDTESTWSFERSAAENSPLKYVVNAEYWLIDQLTQFSKCKANQNKIVEAYVYIVSKLIDCYGKPNLDFGDKDAPYKEYILFDNINMLFRNRGMLLIRNVYQSLNDLLAADPHYMHQRAKCLIKSASIETDITKKKEFLELACRDAAVAGSVFKKRYLDSGNEKIQISAAHVTYTRALALCHLCALENYSDYQHNSDAIEVLFNAFQSPYIKYDEAKNDTYNYNNAILRIVTSLIAQKTQVDADKHNMLAILFKIIANN